MRAKTVGYIVIQGGGTCELCFPGRGAGHDAPANGVLMFSDPTLFPMRRKAMAAINRTIKYRGDRDAGNGSYFIRRVTEMPTI